MVGVGLRLCRKPTPTNTESCKTQCHSERSEESEIFNRTTIIHFMNKYKTIQYYLVLNGIVTVNFEPLFFSDTTSIEPSISVTRLFVRDNPKPIPLLVL